MPVLQVGLTMITVMCQGVMHAPLLGLRDNAASMFKGEPEVWGILLPDVCEVLLLPPLFPQVV